MTIPAALQLALQHHQAGQLEDAEAICRQVLAVERDHLGALCLLGVIARDRGRGEEAVSLLGQVCARVPENAEIRSQLAETYRKLGRLDEAIAEYRRVIETRPELAAAHYNLGIAWKDQDHLPEAISAFRTAVFLQPDFAAAHTNLGNALRAEGHFAEAIAVFRRVLQIQPGDVNAFSNLGSALADAGRLEEAIAAYREGLRLRPEDADLWNSLGIVFSKQARIDESVAAYGTALRLRPDLPWIHSNVLFNHHYRTDLEPEALFREHCRWDEVHAGPLRENIAPHPNDPSPGRRLRIGYVSADFCDHSVARFLEHLLAGHDRGQMEVFCYADLRRPDAVTARLRLHAAHWREIAGITDAQAAELIRRDGIDLLVDLAGHSGGNRLLIFARKPAPVQVTWLGYCDTTGMRVMDYRFTDAQADPPGMTEHLHTEQLVRLPETFACFRPADAAPAVRPLPALAGGHVTFASLHNLAKLNDPLLERWAKILHATPGSRLLLAATGLDEGECRRRFCEFFAQRGIGSERLEFRGRVPLAEYLALHGEVDVLLDSHPFSGHTVSCDALWMGVPVVTLAGDRHCARMVASVLTNVGLPELIAHTPEQYVELAVALATDLPRLAALRAGLRARMAASPLTDSPRFARHVEAAYRQMWRTWCAAQPALSPS